MKLLDRITMLIRADAHGVVESIEDRNLLLKQYVREAEIEVDHKRARLAALAAGQEQLSSQQTRVQKQIEQLDADVELALDQGKDDLARFTIKKLLPARQQATHLQERLAQIQVEQDKLSERLTGQEAELEGMKTKVRAYLAQPAPIVEEFAGQYGIADEDVEMELLRRRQAAQGAA